MRAREFIHEFAPPGLAGALQQTIAAAKQPQQTTQQQTQQNPSPNQTKTPATPQGSQGTANAQQATSGGTQTPQNGVSTTGTPPQQKQPMGQQTPQQAGQQTQQTTQGNKPLGIGGAFLSGLTGGKATSLGSLAKLGGAAVARGANMGNTAGQIDQSRYDSELKTGNQSGGMPTPQELQTTLKQGSTIKIPGQDDFKVGKIDNTGIELTGNKLGKVKVDLKSLAG
jgi:hypothetical protein